MVLLQLSHYHRDVCFEQAPRKTTSSTFTTFSIDTTGCEIMYKQHFLTVSSVVMSGSNSELMYFYFFQYPDTLYYEW